MTTKVLYNNSQKTQLDNIFIETIDEMLKDEYNKPIKRVEFHSFLKFISYLIDINSSVSEKTIAKFAFFQNKELRKIYKRRTFNKKIRYAHDWMIETLAQKDILVSTDYIINKQTRRYFFGSIFYMNMREKMVEYIKSGEIDQKLTRKRNKKDNKNKNFTMACLPQYELLLSKRFNIDTLSAMSEALKVANGDDEKFMNYNASISNLHNKDIYTTEGFKTPRIYTNFTNLKKELRKYCTIDGEKLVEIDGKSSQLFILSNLLAKTTNIGQSFINEVINGDIYEYIHSEYVKTVKDSTEPFTFDKKKNKMVPLNINKDAKLGRKEIKPELLKILFKEDGKKAALEDIFKQSFPDVYEYIKNETNLAAKLQTIEAGIYVHVTNKLNNENIPCLSVHDSIYCKEKDYENVKQQLINRMKELNFIFDPIFG